MRDASARGAARFALRWPKFRRRLTSRLNADPRLAELCEAREAAWIAFEYWSHSRDDAAPARATEYRALGDAIEQDILRLLS